MNEDTKQQEQKGNEVLPCVSGVVEYIQLISTGTKAYWDERCKHFISGNRRFHVSLESALERTDMYIHYR